MDEIFSSTNPEEGISGGYAICEMLEVNTGISIITTHFTQLTKLETTAISLVTKYQLTMEK